MNTVTGKRGGAAAGVSDELNNKVYTAQVSVKQYIQRD